MALKIFGASLFGDAPKPCYQARGGKAGRVDCPLPNLLPGLFGDPPTDEFELRETILDDAYNIAKLLARNFYLKADTNAHAVRTNLEAILDVAVAYEALSALKRRNLERLYQNNLTLFALSQLCTLRSTSEIAHQIQEHMILGQLAIASLHYGFLFLREPERDDLLQNRSFDFSDPREKKMRDKFLQRYSEIADRMFQLSADRFFQRIGEKHGCTETQLRVIEQTIRYAPRLMGRTASVGGDVEARLLPTASYIGMLAGFASGWASKNKPVPLLLGEEWNRAQVYYKRKDIETSARHSIHAIQDLFALGQCRILPDFRGTGQDAIYDTVRRRLFAPVPVNSAGEPIPPALLDKPIEEGGYKGAGYDLSWKALRPKDRLDNRTLSVKDAMGLRLHFGGKDPLENFSD